MRRGIRMRRRSLLGAGVGRDEDDDPYSGSNSNTDMDLSKGSVSRSNHTPVSKVHDL